MSASWFHMTFAPKTPFGVRPSRSERARCASHVQAVQRGVRRRRRRRGVREQPGDVRVADVVEVVERRGRDAGGGSRLEELLGMPGDAGRLQRLAQQRAAAALGRADQVRGVTAGGARPAPARARRRHPPAARCRRVRSVRGDRRLVGVVDRREAGDLARARLRVEALRVARSHSSTGVSTWISRNGRPSASWRRRTASRSATYGETSETIDSVPGVGEQHGGLARPAHALGARPRPRSRGRRSGRGAACRRRARRRRGPGRRGRPRASRRSSTCPTTAGR